MDRISKRISQLDFQLFFSILDDMPEDHTVTYDLETRELVIIAKEKINERLLKALSIFRQVENNEQFDNN